MKKVSIANDHAGVNLKKELIPLIQKLGYEVVDHGCHTSESVDYPDFATLVCQDIQNKTCEFGVLICGTGIGMAISANKFDGVRAASLTDVFSAQMTRKHNDLNVLCLGSRVVGGGLAAMIAETFFTTTFEGGRHADRVKKIYNLEKNGK